MREERCKTRAHDAIFASRVLVGPTTYQGWVKLRPMYFEFLRQMTKQLHQLNKWFDIAQTFAAAKTFDAQVLLQSRLAPDQFSLLKQVQITCDTAKLMISLVTGKDAPKQADDESTFDELRTRVRDVLAYLEGFSASDFDDVGSKIITQPRWQGKVMSGADYFLEHGIPNFFFHLSHCYAILRHNGVPLGKKDYLGSLNMREA